MYQITFVFKQDSRLSAQRTSGVRPFVILALYHVLFLLISSAQPVDYNVQNLRETVSWLRLGRGWAPLYHFDSTIAYLIVVVVCLSGSALFLINVVAVHRARLVLGWVSVCWRLNFSGWG